jgi:predicted nucleic-acid-binding protein
VISLDTNVIVRLFVDDGSHQQIKAARKAALEAKQVFITQIVQVELIWVLSEAYEFGKTQVLQVLHELNENKAFVLQSSNQFSQALKLFEMSNADFSDCLMLMESKQSDSIPVYTFDKRFAKQPDVQLLTAESK